MSEYLSKLNEIQREVVQYTEGPVLLIAGAGSGKTRVLTHRIAYIVETQLALPSQILAITFTNKATAEMKERLMRMLPDITGMWVCTIHSMCVKILRMYIDRLGYSKSFTIYSEQDKDRVIKRIMTEMGIDVEKNAREFKWHIGNAKNNNYPPDVYNKEFGSRLNEVCQVYTRYEQELKRSNALDFDDLLLKTYDLLYHDTEVCHYYQEKFHYVHIDEFQDTNIVQYKLVNMLVAGRKNIFAVGDDDQSIYAFRGAKVENVFSFQKDYPNVKVFKLEQNYRSTKSILDAANMVIKKNTTRMQKKLWTENGDGEPVQCRAFYDETNEASAVVSTITQLHDHCGYAYSDFAILMRVNALSRNFEQECLKYGIASRIYGGFKFFERKEIKDILGYFRLLSNPFDEEALLRVVNTPKRGIGESALQTLRDYANAHDQTMFETILAIETNTELPKGLVGKLLGFRKIMLDLITNVQLMSLSDFAEYGVNATGIREIFRDDSEDSRSKLMNIDELVASIKSFSEQNKGMVELVDYVESVTLLIDMDDGTQADAVTIATIHGAKGLEFKCVFIVGLEEGIFPNSRVKESDSELEEERRLMYVAITRAKERLYLTHAKSRFLFGDRSFCMESPFFTEVSQYADKIKSIAAVKSAPNFSMTQDKSVKGYIPQSRVDTSEKDYSLFAPGVVVIHPKFGEGTIVAMQGSGIAAYADIGFKGIGIKTFALQFAPLCIKK